MDVVFKPQEIAHLSLLTGKTLVEIQKILTEEIRNLRDSYAPEGDIAQNLDWFPPWITMTSWRFAGVKDFWSLFSIQRHTEPFQLWRKTLRKKTTRDFKRNYPR